MAWTDPVRYPNSAEIADNEAFLNTNVIDNLVYLKENSGGAAPLSNYSFGNFSGSVNSITFTPNGDMYVCGYFHNVNGVTNTANIAKYSSSTSQWQSINTAQWDNAYDKFRCLASDSDGNVYCGFNAASISGVSASNIAMWNGSAWTALGSGVNGAVNKIVIDSANDVHVFGEFTTAGGSAANRYAKWDGTAWSTIGTGYNGLVRTACIDKSNTNIIYCAGDFTQQNGVTCERVGKINISSATYSAAPNGHNGGVWGMDTTPNGTVYTYSTVLTNGFLARVHYSMRSVGGGAFAGFSTGLGEPVNQNRYMRSTVLAVANDEVYYGGPVFAGGAITGGIAKWNGTSWSAGSTGKFESSSENADSLNCITVTALAKNGSYLYVGHGAQSVIDTVSGATMFLPYFCRMPIS